MPTKTYFGRNTQSGAPTLNNLAGSLLNVLRAFLVTGFNLRSVTSITVTSGVAVAVSAAHGFVPNSDFMHKTQVQIDGAPNPLLNGEKYIISTDTNTVTYSAPGVPDGTYTGSISAKTPGAGWSELFTDGNQSVFGRTDPAASTQLLWVDDRVGATALAAIVEAASGIGSYTNAKSANGAAGSFWSKGVDSVAAKPYMMVSTPRGFYMLVSNHLMYFADLVSYWGVDAYPTILCTSTLSTADGSFTSAGVRSAPIFGQTFNTTNPRICRGRAGNSTGTVGVSGSIVGFDTSELGARGSTDLANVPIVRPVMVSEQDVSAAHPIRGHLPGMAVPCAAVPFTSYAGVTAADGARFVAVAPAHRIANGNSPTTASVLISLEDDWY